MEIKILSNASLAADFVADEVMNQIISNPCANICLPTGRTMDAVYYFLSSKLVEKSVDYSKIKFFVVNEYIGLKEDSQNSFRAYLDLHLFKKLHIASNNIYFPNAQASDIDSECSFYESQISKLGGIDLLILGIGKNGHIGLNEPGSSIDSRSRVVALTNSTRVSNKNLVHDEIVPLTAITLGIGTILESKKCIMVATGETKSEIVQKTVNGDVNSKVPATAIKTHKNSIFVLDSEAAKLI